MLQGIIQLMTGVNYILRRVTKLSEPRHVWLILPSSQSCKIYTELIFLTKFLLKKCSSSNTYFEEKKYKNHNNFSTHISRAISAEMTWFYKTMCFPKLFTATIQLLLRRYILEICKILQLCPLPAYCTLFPFHTISCMQFSPEHVLT